MKREPQDDMLLRSYLLGELREEEADRLERRLLQEDELFELAEAVEADLLAAAARGDLAPAERERVLQRLASSPQGRERLALARSLNDEAVMEATLVVPVVVPFRRRVPPPAIRWAALAASLLILPILVWFAWHSREHGPDATSEVSGSTPTPVSPKAHIQETTPRSPGSVNLPGETTPKPASGSVTPKKVLQQTAVPVDVIAITLSGFRGGEDEVAKLHLSPSSRLAEFQIDMESLETLDAKSFAVAIHRDERTIWEGSATKKKDGRMLVVQVPSETFSAGRYEIAVTPEGESDEMSQEFQVVKKKH